MFASHSKRRRNHCAMLQVDLKVAVFEIVSFDNLKHNATIIRI